MAKAKKPKPKRFDPATFQAEKLAWVRKVTGDARTCATYYGMDQRELDLLGLELALGQVGFTEETAGRAMDAIRDLLAEARRQGTRSEPRPVDPEIDRMLREELAKAGGQ